MSDFYLILASNGSPKIYPSNTAYQFFNPVSRTIHLPGKWTVALHEMTYENTINTIVDEKIRIITNPDFITEYKKMDEYSSKSVSRIYVTMAKKPNEQKIIVTLKQNEIKKSKYSYPYKFVRKNNEDIVMKEGESAIEMKPLDEGEELELWGTVKYKPPVQYEDIEITPGYYSTEEKLCDEMNRLMNGKARFVIVTEGGEKYFKVDNLDANKRIDLMYGLHYVLGYQNTALNQTGERADRKADLARGAIAMFVYCDIVDNTIVGDTEVPLLRTVHLQKTDRGQVVNHIFNPGFYVRVNKSVINVIEINVRSDSGEWFPFAKECKMLLVLHFKEEGDNVQKTLTPLTHYNRDKFYVQ